MYKTETHLHTAEISGCAKIKACEMVRLYHEAGYKTMFVTDHLNKHVFDYVGDLPWEDKVTIYLSGFYKAREEGKLYGMNILLGAEITFTDAPNDYLVYGITREFLNEHPEIYKMGIEEFHKIAHKHNLFVVQAHPFRDNICFPTPQFVDGMEVYNSNPRHQDFSDKSEQCANENNLYKTYGSDAHRLEDIGKSGVLSAEEIKSTEDYINLVKSGNMNMYKG